MADVSARVFISYARSDYQFVTRLSQDLLRAQVPVWVDTHDIRPGDPWDESVENALLKAAYLILVLSPAASESRDVMNEIEFARRLGVRIIPVLCQDCRPRLGWVRLHRIDMSRDYQAGLADLLNALRRTSNSLEPQVPACWLDSYLGGSTAEWHKELQRSIGDVAKYKLVNDHQLTGTLADIQPCDSAAANGYETFVTGPGPVVRSRRVDAWLRQCCASGQTVPLHFDDSAVDRIAERTELTEDAARLVVLLKCLEVQARQSGHRFENQAKLSLSSDLATPDSPITAFRGSYYLSAITNELCSRNLVRRGEEEHILFRGSRIAPWRGTPPQLAPLSDSLLGNHIGVSTIAHTSDNKLVLWVQTWAQQSVDKLAPTGSGSADWGDRSTDLLNTVRTGMQRELREESSRRDRILDAGAVGATRVLGYYRWVSRGGKPEFVGITKLKVSAAGLHPDDREVATRSEDQKPVFEATSVESLGSAVSELLRRHDLSIPLHVNLQCLRDCLDNPAERQMLSQFLWSQ